MILRLLVHVHVHVIYILDENISQVLNLFEVRFSGVYGLISRANRHKPFVTEASVPQIPLAHLHTLSWFWRN